jgi:hypothetical protein
MLFIFGTPRSGTTLLAQALNTHDDIAIAHESDFIVPATFILDRIEDATIGRKMICDSIIHSVYYRSGMSISEFLGPGEIEEIINSTEYSLAAILDAIYGRLALKAGKKIGGDRSPNDLLSLRFLVKNLAFTPETCIIHIVRDIRDIMVSLHKLNWDPNIDLYFPRSWAESNLYLYSLFRYRSKYMLIKYEDFVRSPRSGLAGICAFLGFDFQEKMLDPSTRHPLYRDMPQHANLFNPISADRIGSYRKALSRSSLKNITTQAREALRVFGY